MPKISSILLGCFILMLTACALTRGGPCRELAYQWRDLTANDLVAIWGEPDQSITLKNNHRLLIYLKEPGSNAFLASGHELIPYAKKMNFCDPCKPCYVQFEVDCRCIIIDARCCGNCVGDIFIPFECLHDAPCWNGPHCS